MNNNPHSDFFDFETLELYKKSLDFTDFAYDLIALCPKEERYELGSQLNRASA